MCVFDHFLELMRFCFKGRYKCEVSAEAPNFQTVFGIANMSIVGQ